MLVEGIAAAMDRDTADKVRQLAEERGGLSLALSRVINSVALEKTNPESFDAVSSAYDLATELDLLDKLAGIGKRWKTR
mgnify:CR=1 FL=1